ncbi:MAG: hypothetical protein PHS15_07845 [Clostridiaceae bacterium]|nr:hypothetical protein [Clostridiaceae bacterium]
MRIIPEKALNEMEKNIYSGVKLLKGTIVFLWTLLCLFLINRGTSFLYTYISGGLFYISLLVLCLVFFKDIRRYWSFPKENKKIPVFIGHKLDTIFSYPIFLMALIGIISNLLTVLGFFPAALQQMNTGGSKTIELIARIMLFPLVAFTEELLNLLLVSFLYKKMKLLKNFRLIGSILSAALIFGILHSFGWGLNTAILIGISYIPVFFVTLYTGNIWISFLAHLYNDLISFTKAYYGSYHFLIIAAISLIPVMWAIRTMVRKIR